MPAINSDVLKELMSAIIADNFVQTNIAKDVNNNFSVRPSRSINTGQKLPGITVWYEDGSSEELMPASRDLLRITMWTDPKIKDYNNVSSFAFRKNFLNAMEALLNRKGSEFNNIDVGTNTGVRIALLLKQSSEINFDDEVKLDYSEIIFNVIRSEQESFLTSDAGDADWV